MANKIDYSNELYRLETSLHHILDKAQELVANFMLENNLATVNFNTDLDGNSPDHPDFDEEQYERHRVFCYAHHFGEPNKEMPLMNITLHVTENKWQETMMNDSEWKPSNYSFTFIAGEGEKKYFNVVDDVALYLEILDWLMSRY